MKFFTEDTYWTSHEGKRRKLKNLSDPHLANLLHFVKDKTHYSIKLKEVLLGIVKKRGLKKKFLKRAQIPYKNKNKKWEIWVKKEGFIEVEE